ncbi:MAG: hypothetical protein HKN16_03545 [Saprospiraceae bacterium]|nr:hypothetical protein [Saprospiraceae bacterium]
MINFLKKNLLLILQIFTVIGALPAGISLITTPDGSGVGIPPEILKNAPFDDFLVPGIALVVFLGLANLIGGYMTWKNHPRAGFAALICGGLMMGFIIIEVAMIGLVSSLQPLFFIVGAVIFYLGWKKGKSEGEIKV